MKNYIYALGIIAASIAPRLVYSLDFDSLARDYAPEMRFHPDEKFPLVNAPWIINRSGISLDDQVIVRPGSINEETQKMKISSGGKSFPIFRKKFSDPYVDNLALNIPEKFYGGKDNNKNGKAICYAHVRQSLNSQAIDISYIFFYPYNGTARSGLPGITILLDKLGVGHHEGDIEHITIRLDKTGKKILGVYFSVHGGEGNWYENQATPKDEGYRLNKKGQLISWVALDTHGNHIKAGQIKRKPPVIFSEVVKALGVLVEETSDDGARVDCRENLEIIPHQNPATGRFTWLNFAGKWGSLKPKNASKGVAGPKGIPNKAWWDEELGGPKP